MQCTMVICGFLPKTAYPIVFTDEGTVISENPASKNASSPMDSTPLSIVTEERLLHTEKASSPISLTFPGIVTETREVQCW